MLWHRRDALRAAPKVPALPALALLLPALALLVFAIKTQAEAMESSGLLLTVCAAVWLALGTRLCAGGGLPARLFVADGAAARPGPE